MHGRSKGSSCWEYTLRAMSAAALLFLTATWLSMGCDGKNEDPKPIRSPKNTESRAKERRPVHTRDGLIARWALQEDLDQLRGLLEDSHPDPYTGGGGRVSFHRRVRAIHASIPKEGLSPPTFLRLVRPLVASVKDGHTFIHLGDRRRKKDRVFPVDWQIVEGSLVAARVYGKEYMDLVGGRLESLHGVQLAELVGRMQRMRGFDNENNNLVHLIEAIKSPEQLMELLDQKENKNRAVTVELILKDGSRHKTRLEPISSPFGTPIEPKTSIKLPVPNASDLAWGFLDAKRETAYLRIDSMMRYREAFEYWRGSGYRSNLQDHLNSVARKALKEKKKGQEKLPKSVDGKIMLVPSATDTLRELFSTMKAASTRNLVVDLRKNGGGNSFFTVIMLYFLFGADFLPRADWGYQIPRYSELFFARHKKASRSDKLKGGLKKGSYDFSEEAAWHERVKKGPTKSYLEHRKKHLEKALALSPTFNKEYTSRRFRPGMPPRIVVLTSARTYSAGFDLAAQLYKSGAEIMGVASSQAGNCFIDSLPFTLKHSGLQGTISYKLSFLFPGDPVAGRSLRPEVELDYSKLRQMSFDPNATVLLALKHLGKPK